MIATDDVLNLNTEDWEFQTHDTILVPYRPDAKAFFPEDYMVSLYFRLIEQGLLSIIFPGMGINHLNQFIGYVNRHQFLICLAREGDKIIDTAGFGYITEADGVDGARKGGFGFGFFREWHATRHARTLSWFMLAFWMKRLNIDVLFGTTLKANRLARNFSYNFGFKNHVDIPNLFFRNGELQDGTVMSLDINDFEPLYDQWREEYAFQPMKAAVRG